MSFNSLGLSAELLRAVAKQGYGEPTPIQRQAIPAILEGRDILAGAQTGTGKTAGFTLPMLQRLMKSHKGHVGGRRSPRALILTPTRELAAQVRESVGCYGKYLPLKSLAIFGGVGFRPQADTLRKGVDILVATPGRLIDHLQQQTVDLSRIEILVLDEADRMLDMGFIPAIRRIIAKLPRDRQNLLFSATYSDGIRVLADTLLRNPARIEVAKRNTAAEHVIQIVHPVDRERKREMLSQIIGSLNWRQVLVFTRTKHGADRLARQLDSDGLRSVAIHGNKSQGARTRALDDFKRGAVRVLVATDIASRGLDIDQLPHVVNYELPQVPEDYVHRIGRTGRAGMEGTAVSLVSADERKLLRDIEKLLKQELREVAIEGYAAVPAPRRSKPRAEDRKSRNGGGGETRHSAGQHRVPVRDRGQRRSGGAPRAGRERQASTRLG